jgi:ketosteroid isomerase-like protein
MSEESATPDLVELTREAIESVPRRDFETAMSVYGPDSVWDMSSYGLGTFEGVAAIRGLFEDWAGAYDDFEAEVEEILPFANGVTFAVVRHGGRPRGSTGHVEARDATVIQWAGRLIVRATHYTDVDEAQGAAERLAEERG